MKKQFWTHTTFTLFLLMIGTAQASTTTYLINRNEYSVGAGDMELNFRMLPTIIRGDLSDETFELAIGANYFWTDMIAPGVDFEIISGGGTTARFMPNAKFYWPGLGRFLPYAFAGVGYAHFPGSDMFNLAIGPGFNYLLTNSVSIGAQLRYDLGVGNNTIHVIRLPIQFALYFRVF